jgi:curved DNA-binding protein
MNYYEILGVNENASQDDIKKAYKKLAMTHHPDRGGDNKKFQEISQAYDTLSDSQKKSQYDAELHGYGDPFVNIRTGGGFPNFGDMFGFHFGSGFAPHQGRKNRDLTLRIQVTFKQSYVGTQTEARYQTPSGKTKTVIIDVPPGVQSGQIIRFASLGDDSIPNIPPGNLNVNITVEADPEWFRRDNDVIKIVHLNAFEAILGKVAEIECLDGTLMPLRIRPGVQHGTEFASRGRGFMDISGTRRGSLIIVVHVEIPQIDNPEILNRIEKLNADISNIP